MAAAADPRAELVAVSPEAARRGVRRATSVAHARAVCAALVVRVASPALEIAARDALLDVALSCSPRAAPAPRAGGAWAGEAAVFLDASGVRAAFRSERGFAGALVARAARLGLPGDVAVASSRGIALVAARRLLDPQRRGVPERERADDGSENAQRVCVLPTGAEPRFLAPLSVDLLDPPDALAETLTRFGVRCVGDLLALPRRAIAARLGPGILRLIALARGEEVDTPLPVPDCARLAEAIDLEAPVDRLEPLSFALRGLLSRLRDRLEARHLACGDLELALELEGGGRDARRIGVSAPTLDLRILLRLAGLSLAARPPAAAVTAVALETEGRVVQADQLDLFRPAGPAPAVLGRTLVELEILCGSGRVGAPRVADDHRPEAFGMAAFRPAPRPGTGRGTRPGPERGTAAAPTGSRPGAPLAVRALRPPVPARVRLARGVPVSVRSAIASGRAIRVAGPWRTGGGWWSEDRFAYDHYDVQTGDGTVVRLRFDRLRSLWHVDAVYD